MLTINKVTKPKITVTTINYRQYFLYKMVRLDNYPLNVSCLRIDENSESQFRCEVHASDAINFIVNIYLLTDYL